MCRQLYKMCCFLLSFWMTAGRVAPSTDIRPGMALRVALRASQPLAPLPGDVVDPAGIRDCEGEVGAEGAQKLADNPALRSRRAQPLPPHPLERDVLRPVRRGQDAHQRQRRGRACGGLIVVPSRRDGARLRRAHAPSLQSTPERAGQRISMRARKALINRHERASDRRSARAVEPGHVLVRDGVARRGPRADGSACGSVRPSPGAAGCCLRNRSWIRQPVGKVQVALAGEWRVGGRSVCDL